MQAIMYSTDHCTLCEQALDMLLSMPELAGAQLEVVDIAGNTALEERYAACLPTLLLVDGDTRLALEWPFNTQRVRDSLGQFE